MCGHTRDPIIYSKFHRNPFKCFGTPGGQNLSLPITLASRFYNSLYYRTSRDKRTVALTTGVAWMDGRSRAAGLRQAQATSGELLAEIDGSGSGGGGVAYEARG